MVDCKPRDTDGDGIPDHLDPDDDNDGIPDYLDPDSMAFLLYKNTKAMDAIPGIFWSQHFLSKSTRLEKYSNFDKGLS